MTMAYWNQWSHEEIMSMYGIEVEEEIFLDEEYEEENLLGEIYVTF
jgi:hypothetical protein